MTKSRKSLPRLGAVAAAVAALAAVAASPAAAADAGASAPPPDQFCKAQPSHPACRVAEQREESRQDAIEQLQKQRDAICEADPTTSFCVSRCETSLAAERKVKRAKARVRSAKTEVNNASGEKAEAKALAKLSKRKKALKNAKAGLQKANADDPSFCAG